VRFHNGDELTAEDVVFTFSRDRMFGTTLASAHGRTIPIGEGMPAPRPGKELPPEVPAVARRSWPALERVEAVDRHTVRFHNATPDVTMEGRLSRYGSDIMNRRAFEEAPSWLDWARRPVTTGPYKVAEFRPDVSLTLVAHDEYWGGRPPLRQIRFVEVPEVSSRINGLLSGEYHFACDIPPDQIAGIELNRAFEVQGGTVLNHRLICFDKTHAALRDARVRRAFTHAIDREAIVESLWAGRTTVPRGLQWPYYEGMFHADWEVPRFDPAEAAAWCGRAATAASRSPTACSTTTTPTRTPPRRSWSRCGAPRAQRPDRDAGELGPDPGAQPDPRGARLVEQRALQRPRLLHRQPARPNGQQQQVGEWTNEEMNRLSVELETSTDRERRRAVFRRMLEICEREDPAYTVLHQNATFTAKRRDIRWKAAPAFAMDFRADNWGA
jgi:peptide/nickel transport system substrate-binding protein